MTDAEITLEPEGLEPFVTANCADGKYWVEIKLPTMDQMHRAHSIVLDALSRSTLPREGQGEAQVFTYEHSAMGGGMYATTISNDPPPPNLWCRIKKFSPATLSPSPAVRDGVDADELRRMAFDDILNFKPDPLSARPVSEQIASHARATIMDAQTAISARALSTQEQGNG